MLELKTVTSRLASFLFDDYNAPKDSDPRARWARLSLNSLGLKPHHESNAHHPYDASQRISC